MTIPVGLRTRYAVQHKSDNSFWCGSNRWGVEAAARWFDSIAEATLAALRELPDKASQIRVVPIGNEAA